MLNPPAGVTYYQVTLDGTPLIELPISAASWTNRNGTPSYLQVTVPTLDLIDEISARVGNELILYHSFDGVHAQLASIGNIDRLRTDQGGTSENVTLSGERQTTYNTPKTVVIPSISYRSITNGLRRWRTVINPAVLPGDTVDYDGETFVVDYVTGYVSAGAETFEISELAS